MIVQSLPTIGASVVASVPPSSVGEPVSTSLPLSFVGTDTFESMPPSKAPPSGEFCRIDDIAPDIDLPMERPLYAPAWKPVLKGGAVQAGDEVDDTGALYSQFVVDKAALADHVQRMLRRRSQVTLPELIEGRPLQQGLAELVAYLSLATESGRAVFDETVEDEIAWVGAEGQQRRAKLPRVIFSR